MPIALTFKDDFGATVKVWTDDIEQAARDQLHKMAALPFIHKHIAVMPDVHWGKGSTVGSVIPTIKAIVPAAVGVDIGCGMVAQKLSIRADQLPDSLAAIRSAIEAAVPHGRTDNGGRNDKGAHDLNQLDSLPGNEIATAWGRLVDSRYMRLIGKHPSFQGPKVNTVRHLGTLGTGNHFIELCLDTAGGVWLMLHSGSRGIGNKIGTHFIEAAKKEMERWHIRLADPDLAYLPEGSPLFDDYWSAVSWAQDYATTNRHLMLSAALRAVCTAIGMDITAKGGEAINCHHNYVAIERHYGSDVYVTRKGAVRAQAGDMGIIPGSMGARSFIVRGKGNPESFNSCSHGAGRRMSRGEANRRFTVADLAEQTAGIECRKDAGVVDEIPAAYKPIQDVIDRQRDLIDVVAELRQVLCVKG